MSKRIVDGQIEDAISRRNLATRIDHIAFSFKYMTNNKQYGMESIYSLDVRKSKEVLSSFINKMQSLSKQDMTTAKRNGKIQGCEAIPYRQFYPNVQDVWDNIEIISKSTVFSVFRFHQNDYRMICKTDSDHPNLLYIIGLDMNYSAYSHG